MKYIPCGTASFLATRYYCGYNKTCDDIYIILERNSKKYMILEMVRFVV